jgi:predicted aminopeptidase
MFLKNIHYYRHIAMLFFIFLISGCASLNYYRQSVQGQLEIFQKRQSIEELLQDDNISDSLRTKLNTVLELRKFSIQELGLPDNNSYSSYADLGRDYVIWNIFATEEFSLEPITWCYLIVGCLSYRGYFSESDAKKHAIKLDEQGYDVYLGGVSAYSTLGWFEDPVLNTMLGWNDIRLAKVIFHELAHQQIYIKNDTEFNEAYADTVAHIGVTKWLEQGTNENLLKEYEQARIQEKQFISLIMDYKIILSEIYKSTEDESMARKRKKEIFHEMAEKYNAMSRNWKINTYKNWFSDDLNNAKLSAIVTYRKYVPAFLGLYEKLEHDLTKFYFLVKSLSACNPVKRKELLEQQKIQFEC